MNERNIKVLLSNLIIKLETLKITKESKLIRNMYNLNIGLFQELFRLFDLKRNVGKFLRSNSYLIREKYFQVIVKYFI